MRIQTRYVLNRWHIQLDKGANIGTVPITVDFEIVTYYIALNY